MIGVAASARVWPGARPAMAALLALLLGYGLFSTPGLVRHWGVSGAGIALFVAFALVVGRLLVRSRPFGTAGWAAFGLLAAGLRLASAAIVVGRVSPGDSHYYIVIAQGLLAGHGWVMLEPSIGVPVRALYPPFYATLLAGWGAIAGFATPSLLVLSGMIDLAAAWLLARLGARIGQARAGQTAAALYLIWPSVLFSAPLAQKESLCVLLILALVHAWLRALEDPRPLRDAVALGIPAALLALTQPGEAPLVLLFGIVLVPLAGWRRILAIGMPAAAVAAVAMLPWWIRNWLVLGAFVPLTTSGGIGLWIGNNPEATGNWMPYPAQLHGMPELVFVKAAGAIARDWIVHHPVGFVRLNIAKFLRATAIGDSGIVRLAAMTLPISAATAALLLPLSHGAHLLMLGGGALAMRARRDPATAILLALLVACVAQLVLFGVWFEFGERHRDFLTPFLLLTIAVAAASRDQPSAAQ